MATSSPILSSRSHEISMLEKPAHYYLVTFGIVTDRQTDRRKSMHKSPPCISTGGLKNASYCHMPGKCGLQ